MINTIQNLIGCKVQLVTKQGERYICEINRTIPEDALVVMHPTNTEKLKEKYKEQDVTFNSIWTPIYKRIEDISTIILLEETDGKH
jgi:hypothetical protein